MFAAVAFHVSQIICWQIDRLKIAGLPVLLFVDEPALCLEVSAGICSFGRAAADCTCGYLGRARLRGAYAGLHCCAAGPVSRMCRVNPDILSFDAHQGLEFSSPTQTPVAFVRDGGIVAYGMIPTLQDLSTVRAEQIFSRWLTLASLAGDPQQFARSAMITATCGLGLLTPEAATESFAMARHVGKLIRNLAGEPAAVTQPIVASEVLGS